MKTKKVMIYVLSFFFIIAPLLNFESGAAMRTVPVMKTPPSCSPPPQEVIIPVCFMVGDKLCCEDFICYGPDLSNCDILPTGPRCYPSTPAS